MTVHTKMSRCNITHETLIVNIGRKVVRHLEGELQQHEKKLDSAENEIATNRTKVGDLEENIQQLAEKYDEELGRLRSCRYYLGLTLKNHALCSCSTENAN